MLTPEHVIDDRVLVLGLDELYRNAIKKHESVELRLCARRVAVILGIEPGQFPVEGYYSESPRLTEYFSLMRTLQAVPVRRLGEVRDLPEFQRLRQVASSPIYGQADDEEQDSILPTRIDCLARALRKLAPDWTVAGLTAAAETAARRTNDISLPGLAARTRNAVVLAALRESVVLYVRSMVFGSSPKPRFIWAVSNDLAAAAQEFIATFKALFDDELPAPTADQADEYWEAFSENRILGRCARLGQTPNSDAFYHWAIRENAERVLEVHEFWDGEVWTTDRYREWLNGAGDDG